MNDQRIAILTDSGTDTPADFVRAHDVRVVPLHINYSDGTSYRSGVDITEREVIERFSEEIPKTSLPSPQEILDLCEQAKADGYERGVFVTISSALSATNQTVRQMASEIVREKILRHTYDEVPHGVAVEPVVFRERENRNGEPVTDIAVNIICERDAHKGMLIGKGGSLLKTMATEARKDLEDLLGTKVNLQCFVKVRENWRDNEKIITELHLYDE